jgi:hypothetical protein
MTKIPGDRLVIANISVLRTLVHYLAEKGVVDSDEFILRVEQTAAAHREAGDPNHLADAIHALGEMLETSMVGSKRL